MTTALSPSVHEATVRRHMTDDDDPILQALHDAVKQTRVFVTQAQAVTATVMKNTMRTEGARHKAARDAGFELLERGNQLIHDAVMAANAEISAIQAKVKGPSQSKDVISASRQKEMRERLSMLPPERRQAIIQAGIRNNEETLISAVLNSDAWLSGLTDGELALHRNNWATKNFGADLDRKERLAKAIADANRAGTIAISFVEGLTQADLVEKSEALEREANAALAAVNSGLGRHGR
jgi:hypothetical protein